MKNLKLFSVFPIIGILLFLISCAGMQAVTSPEPIKLDITVTSADGKPIEKVEIGPAADQMLTEDQRQAKGFGRLSQLSWIDDKESTLYAKIFSGLSVADVSRLYNDMCFIEANRPNIKRVHLWINSPGGDAFSGMALSDIILHYKAKGYFIEAHANGIIASAAVPVFASCSKRYAARGTIFMVHEAALWKWPGRETSSDIRSQNELMITLQDLYISYLQKPTTNLSRSEWIVREKATTWFNAETAKEWGLVDGYD